MDIRWDNAYHDILTEIFQYLPRRDRMSCYFVCKRWREALENPLLWRKMVVDLDRDLKEPSTVSLTRMYPGYLKILEIGWSNSEQPTRWLSNKFTEITKRSVRFLLVLTNSKVNLQNIKIVAWFEMHRYRKVLYHLSRFLKTQKSLRNISFYNVNLRGTEYLRLLASCTESQNSIASLNFVNCYQHFVRFQNPLPASFPDIVKTLSNLVVLKLDYFILCNGVVDAIAMNGSMNLQDMVVSIKENDIGNEEIEEEKWLMLQKQCPNVKVSFHFHNIYYFEDVKRFLKKSIPLTSFAMYSSKVWYQFRNHDFKKTLNLILKNYSTSLENLDLHIQNNREFLEDNLLKIVERCGKLKYLHFDGVLQNLQILKAILKCKTEKFGDAHTLMLHPRTFTEDMHLILTELSAAFSEDTSKQISINVTTNKQQNAVYAYY